MAATEQTPALSLTSMQGRRASYEGQTTEYNYSATISHELTRKGVTRSLLRISFDPRQAFSADKVIKDPVVVQMTVSRKVTQYSATQINEMIGVIMGMSGLDQATFAEGALIPGALQLAHTYDTALTDPTGEV